MKKGTIIFLAVAACALCAAGGVYLERHGYTESYQLPGDSQASQASSGGSSSEEKGGGSAGDVTGTVSSTDALAVRRLSTGVDANGCSTATFSYAITPSGADQAADASVGWASNQVTDAISDYLSASADPSAQTITVTCKKAFGNRALLTVAAHSDAAKKATVTLDYVKKFLGFKAKSNSNVYWNFGDAGTAAGWDYESPAGYDAPLIDPAVFGAADDWSYGYSVFTADKAYAFGYDATASAGSLCLFDKSFVNETDVARQYKDLVVTQIDLTSYLNGGTLTSSALNALVQSAVAAQDSVAKTYMSTYCSYIGVHQAVSVSARCDTTGASQSYLIDLYAYFPPSSLTFSVAASGVTAETSGIVF
jgi:hypothetical protein